MHKLTWEKGCRPWLAASNDDTRPLLQMVLLDAAGYLVATDTHMLSIIKADVPAEYGQMTLPAIFFKMAERFRADIYLEGERALFHTEWGTVSHDLIKPDAELKTTFPRWTHIPKHLGDAPGDRKHIAFNPSYVMKVGRILGSTEKQRLIFSEKEGGALICHSESKPESFVLLMPLDDKMSFEAEDALKQVRLLSA